MARNAWLAATGAIVSSLATLACCLPFGFLAALGSAGASVYFAKFRPWLLGLSVILLGIGFYQQYHGARCSIKRHKLNLIFLWTAAILVVLILLFPQFVASVLAGGAR